MSEHPKRIVYRWPIFNATFDTIPPYAVCEVAAGFSTIAEVGAFHVQKPTDNGKQYVVNGRHPIAPGTVGRGTDDRGAYVLCNGTPSEGVEWGPVANSWAIGSGGKGFLVNGALRGQEGGRPGYEPTAATTRVRASMIASKGGSGANWITTRATANIYNDAVGEITQAAPVLGEPPYDQLGPFPAVNKSGRFIFKNSTCVVETSGPVPLIIAADSPAIIKADVVDPAYAEQLSGYKSWSGVSHEKRTIDVAGLTVTIDDPLKILDGLQNGNKVFFAVSEATAKLTFTALSARFSASASIKNAMALIRGTVPGRSVVDAGGGENDDPGGTIIPGKLAAGAELYKPDPEEHGFTRLVPDKTGDFNPMDVWNFSQTEFDGSKGDDGILVAGQVFTKTFSKDEIYAVFVINSDKDLASLPGFDKYSLQLPYKDVGNEDFELETLARILKKLFGYADGKNQSIGHDPGTDPLWQDDEGCEETP